MSNPLKPITAQDLTRFHTAKNVHAVKCWMCGNGTWNIQSDDEHPASITKWMTPDGTRETEEGLLTLVLACDNCGTRWDIDYRSIRAWLEENPE